MFKSNAQNVMQRLQESKRAIPGVIRSVLVSQRYAARMRYIAGDWMDSSSILTQQERMFIPQLLDTFMHETFSGSMKFSIQMVPIENLITEIDSPEDFLKQDVHPKLVEWVTEYKRKKGRDYYAGTGEPRSDETIAFRVAFAIQANPYPWLRSKDPTGLRRFIGLTSLPAEKVERLLVEVLEAWVAYMKETLPALVGKEIGNQF